MAGQAGGQMQRMSAARGGSMSGKVLTVIAIIALVGGIVGIVILLTGPSGPEVSTVVSTVVPTPTATATPVPTVAPTPTAKTLEPGQTEFKQETTDVTVTGVTEIRVAVPAPRIVLGQVITETIEGADGVNYTISRREVFLDETTKVEVNLPPAEISQK